jgi:hypothetical protein
MTEAALELPVETAPSPEGVVVSDTQPVEEVKEPVKQEAPSLVAKADAELADGTDDVDVDTPAPIWPEDWRSKMAGNDEAFLKTLNRYASPENFAKAYFELRRKFTSGEAKRALSEDATPEQVAEWRKENGIPENAEGYKIPEFKAVEWSDEDREMIGGFVGKLHAVNAPQPIVDAALGWYAEHVIDQQEKIYQQDIGQQNELSDNLHQEWGPEYRSNLSLAQRAAGGIFGDANLLVEARAPDGRKLGNIPEVVKALAQLGRETYGDAAFVSGDGRSTMHARKEEIERVMKTDMHAYREQGLDKEYRKILEAEEKIIRR